MKYIPHSVAEWVMALGIAFSLGIFFVAVVEDNPWEDHSYEDAPPITLGTPAPHTDGKEKMTCSTCHAILPPDPNQSKDFRIPILVGAPSPHGDERDQQPCGNCHRYVNNLQENVTAPKGGAVGVTAAMQTGQRDVKKKPSLRFPPKAKPLDKEAHEVFTFFRFQGKVTRVFPRNPKIDPGNVTVLVDNGIKQPMWIDLAPYWFLKSEDCRIFKGMFIKGQAAADDPQNRSELAYATTIGVNGKSCFIRNSHLTGLWDPTAMMVE
ncbi:Magnetosome protein mamX [Candidatus Terasakiella magnetica]|uniref:Magnetosome protein mamX n=1 Tax=Candidatus Terasakiella magnetica TaxID=1867952 RepID=A0A1C3RH47_9PROT|nr:magnetosome protein MamX [Candidatus Terasakiella magnetica]SCA56600.1 Magnetosome protein mamX [Candidatus Terasakiella magnetica]